MPTIRMVVPCRGEVSRVDPDGHIYGLPTNTVEPVNLEAILQDRIGLPQHEWTRRALTYDLVSATVLVEIECAEADAAWLGRVVPTLSAITDFKLAEADLMEVVERADTVSPEGVESRVARSRASAQRPLSVSRADLDLWEVATGRKVVG